MVKHSLTIRYEEPVSCMSVLDHFVGLALKRLTLKEVKSYSLNVVLPRAKYADTKM